MKPYRPKVSQGMIKELVPFFPLVFLMAWMAAPIVVNIALYGIFIVGEIDIQSYLIWVEYGLSLTLTVWAVESFLVHRRNLTMIREDRKSTRLNSSHVSISYAVFCLKK